MGFGPTQSEPQKSQKKSQGPKKSRESEKFQDPKKPQESKKPPTGRRVSAAPRPQHPRPEDEGK